MLFRSKEAAPKTNLLVLDEPGDGLDAFNAAAFAAGIVRLRHKSGSIFLITHSDVIVQELAGEATVIDVVKEQGVSSIVETPTQSKKTMPLPILARNNSV